MHTWFLQLNCASLVCVRFVFFLCTFHFIVSSLVVNTNAVDTAKLTYCMSNGAFKCKPCSPKRQEKVHDKRLGSLQSQVSYIFKIIHMHIAVIYQPNS